MSFSQNVVALTGNVQDSRTKEPVSGAKIKLKGAGLTSSTVTDGYFNISGTSIRKLWSENNRNVRSINGSKLLYRQEKNEAIHIRIFDLSGKQHVSLLSGMLEKGLWKITPPRLLPGVYICSIETPQSIFSVKFLADVDADGLRNGMLQKMTAGLDSKTAKIENQSTIIDTLIVEKDGYRTAFFPLETYIRANIKILLEDTTVSNLDEVTIIPDPSWTCYMPDGIPPPQNGEKVFTIELQYSSRHDVGITQFGHRYQYDIMGGNLKGDRITGSVLNGGLDYELTLSNGSTELEQICILRTSDNIPILMRNAGVAPTGEKNIRMVLDFEVPDTSSYTWLHTGKFAATRIVDTIEKTIVLEVHDISNAALTEKKIQIKDPVNQPNQTWECVQITGSQGEVVFNEDVSLGSSIFIGASKRGSRNIIPITGGTISGNIKGKILNGGADYQLNGLDARYTLAPDDGELIIVRNCGPMGKLIPVFEARAAGPYAFLNENKYLSSDPRMGAGGVKITFYEKR